MSKTTFLVVAFLLSAIGLFAQQKTTGNDSLKKIQPQRKWHPYLGLHITGDAEMFYIGPSFQLGTDLQLKKRFLVSSYIHYFGKKVNNVEYGGYFENGKLNILTIAALAQLNTSRNLRRSFFIAGGIAFQYWHDRYKNNFSDWDNERNTLLPAIRFGYFFPSGKNRITIELNATGPYSYGDDNSSVTEILTQFSFLGCRFIF
jgi:hypothetical protein